MCLSRIRLRAKIKSSKFNNDSWSVTRKNSIIFIKVDLKGPKLHAFIEFDAFKHDLLIGIV